MTKKPKPEELIDNVDTGHLKQGEANPFEEVGLEEEDIRLFYDEDGNLREIGGIDNNFRIQHKSSWLVEDVDSVDIGWLREALNDRKMKAWLAPLEKESRFYKEAFENFFLLLVKAKPDIVQVPTPKQYYLLRLLTELVEQEEYEELSKKCTSNVNRSGLVAKTWVESLKKIIDEETLQLVENLDDLNESFKGVMQEMQDFLQRSACAMANSVPGELDGTGKPVEGNGEGGEDGEPCPGCGQHHQKMRPKTAKEMGLTAEEQRQRLRELTKQFGELQKKVKQKLAENQDKIESVTRTFAEEAAPQGKQKSDLLDSMASSFGTSEGELKQIDMSEILEIMERYKDERDIKMIVDQLGRMAKIARKSMRSMTEEVDNIKAEPSELGDQLTKMMPTEMVNFRHPGKKKDFKKRLLESEIDQFKTRGQAPVGRGPIITCKDTSGSMHGARNAWASAFYLAASSVAAKQKRRSVLINFSHGPMKVTEFEKNDTFSKYIDDASYMIGGGTDFEAPLRKALEYIKDSKWNKADILFLTDGLCHLTDEFLKEFNKVKAQREFKVITVLINVGVASDDVVDAFSDEVVLLSDLQKDQDVLETAFAF
jgi:uncharacterized protein with von Willebrand factor type A (vWA) domain